MIMVSVSVMVSNTLPDYQLRIENLNGYRTRSKVCIGIKTVSICLQCFLLLTVVPSSRKHTQPAMFLIKVATEIAAVSPSCPLSVDGKENSRKIVRNNVRLRVKEGREQRGGVKQ